MTKPIVQLSGKDGNVFNLMGICSKTLQRSGQPEKAKEMTKKISSEAKSYDEALSIMSEYCEVR